MFFIGGKNCRWNLTTESNFAFSSNFLPINFQSANTLRWKRRKQIPSFLPPVFHCSIIRWTFNRFFTYRTIQMRFCFPACNACKKILKYVREYQSIAPSIDSLSSSLLLFRGAAMPFPLCPYPALAVILTRGSFFLSVAVLFPRRKTEFAGALSLLHIRRVRPLSPTLFPGVPRSARGGGGGGFPDQEKADH